MIPAIILQIRTRKRLKSKQLIKRNTSMEKELVFANILFLFEFRAHTMITLSDEECYPKYSEGSEWSYSFEQENASWMGSRWINLNASRSRDGCSGKKMFSNRLNYSNISVLLRTRKGITNTKFPTLLPLRIIGQQNVSNLVPWRRYIILMEYFVSLTK